MAAGQFPGIEDEGGEESPLSSSDLLAGAVYVGGCIRVCRSGAAASLATVAAIRSPIRLPNTATAAMTKGALRK
jgi:hypothetical protein